jgi:hypothetical protein
VDHNLIAWHDYHATSLDRGLVGDERACKDPVRVVNAAAESPTPFHAIAAIDGFREAPRREQPGHGQDDVGKNPLSGPARQESACERATARQKSQPPN